MNNTTKAYQVYDNYTEYIFGENQLIDYVTNNLNLEFVEENLEEAECEEVEIEIEEIEITEKRQVKEILNKVYNDVEITLKEALQILKYADYEIEEIEIY